METKKGAAANSNKARSESEVETLKKQQQRETRPSDTAKLKQNRSSIEKRHSRQQK